MDAETTFGKQSCGRKWNRCEVALVVVTVLLVLLVIILAIVLGLEQKKNRDDAPRTVVRTQASVAQAGRIMSYMNVSVDPCEDFWNFACGSWIARTKAPERESGFLDLFTVLQNDLTDQLRPIVSAPVESDDIESVKKMKWFYQSCLDQDAIVSEGVQPMQEFLTSLGGWPMIEASWSDASFNLGAFMAAVVRNGGVILHDFLISPEPTDNTKYNLWVNFRQLALAGQLVSTEAADVAVVNDYTTLAQNIAKAVYNGTDTTRLTQIDNDVMAAFDFAKQISQMLADTFAFLSSGPTTIANFTTDAPQTWDWLAYLNAYAAPNTLTSDTQIYVAYTEYFQGLNTIIQSTANRVIVNYILLASVLEKWAALTEVPELVSLAKQYAELSGAPLETAAPGVTAEGKERWQYCVDLTNNYYGFVASRFYVPDITPTEVVDDVTMIGTQLRASFRSIMENADWMDQATRDYALRKLENMPIMVAYEEKIFDDDWLNTRYEDDAVTSTTSFFHNIITHKSGDLVRMIKYLSAAAPRSEWMRAATLVNAGHIKPKNTVEINGAFLQEFVYHMDYPKYMNFGSMGVFVGHEMTHGFDNQGAQFDLVGNTVNWWSPESKGTFDERGQCLVDQYGQYGEPEYGVQVDGMLTLPENIADNGGMKESYRAYKAWAAEQDEEEPSLPGLEHMSNEQMFFLSWGQLWCLKEGGQASRESSYADVHAPNRWRAVGPLRNMPEFAAAYNCPSGSFMNPDERCTVW